jgi:hypothetical protein
MLCSEIRRTVYFFFEGSLGEKRQLDFKTHLSICADCETRTNIQLRLHKFVLSRLAPQPAPEHLKTRLARTLRALA